MNAPASASLAQDLPSEPDAELVRWIRELQHEPASEAGFERLFKRFYPWVCGLFRRHGFAHGDAEDLAQETLVRTFREIGSLRQPELFRAWLRSIAGNVSRNERRRRARLMRAAPEVSLDGGDDEPVVAVRDTEPAPDEALIGRERRARLREALAVLSPQMRQCLTLRLEQDLKYREIAAVLKISIDTVKAHLAQGKKRLRAELTAELDAKL